MLEVQEPMVTDGDSPRARRTDPATSHAAADKSQKGLSKLRVAVLRMFADLEEVDEVWELTGSEVNAEYRRYRVGAPGEFPLCHPDSPRRRAGELARDCYLDVVGHRKGGYGTEESVYRLSPEGRDYLRRLG